MQNIIKEIFLFLNHLKLYHWNTKNYARHIASDNCFTVTQKLSDEFVEVYIGKYGREKIINTKIQSVQVKLLSDNSVEDLVKNFISFLLSLKLSSSKDTDLVNIRDELISNLNQTLYLFTLE